MDKDSDDRVVGFTVDAAYATASGIIRMSNTSVAYNNGTGLQSDTGGQILTWQNNWVGGNATDGTRTGTITPQ